MRIKTEYFAWLLLLVFIVAGCASFPGGKLPKVSYGDITVPEARPSVDYDALFLALGSESSGGTNAFKEEIERVFANSGYFERYENGTGKEAYHISFLMKNEGDAVVAFVTGFISGSTFLLLPAYARDEYKMTIHVKKNGETLKTYTYEEHMDTWTQLFLVVLAPTHWPFSTARDIFDGMLLNFLHDLQKDRLLEV